MQQERQSVAARGLRLLRNVDRIGLELSTQPADATVGAGGGAGRAAPRVVRALLGLEVAGEDAIHRPGLRYATRLAGHVVVHLERELVEVDVGEEAADVAA